MEENIQFPEFEKRFKEKKTTVYHEDLEQRLDVIAGGFIAVVGIIMLLLSKLMGYILQITGVVLFLFGILLFSRGLVLYRKLIKQYSFHGLTRKTMSEAIMYIAAQPIPREVFLDPRLFHDTSPVSRFNLAPSKKAFIRFLILTAGLVTWPSAILSEHETNLQNRKVFHFSLMWRIVLAPILFAFLYLVVFALGGHILEGVAYSLLYIPIFLYYFIRHFLFLNLYYNNGDWINQVLKSEDVQLEESLQEIFTLLQSEFQYPLRFFLVGDYSILKYTGHTNPNYSRIRMKEAVLYPTIKM